MYLVTVLYERGQEVTAGNFVELVKASMLKMKKNVREINSFGSLLFSSFNATQGTFISVIGLILLFVGYFVVPESATVGLRYVIVLSTVSLYLILLGFHAAYSMYSRERDDLPAVRYASDPPKAYANAVALMLLEPSRLFSYDSVVAIYQENHGMEHLIGLGRVINIQENGHIQVLVTHDLNYKDEWDECKKNNASKLEDLLVKTSVPAFAMEVITNE